MTVVDEYEVAGPREEVTPDEYTIRVHHVGGIGEAGPTGALGRLGNVEWVVYDALEEASDSSRAWDPRYRVVNKAIWQRRGRSPFYVTADPSASSLLLPAASAKDFSVMVGDGSLQVWGVHARVKETLPPVEVYSLDDLVADGSVPPIDFLSIDAQGVDFDILTGAHRMVSERVVGVILEVEYARLYENQPLFCDVQSYLTNYGFRLCDIVNVQYMNVAPYSPEVLGSGFMTVGEAFYLKEFGSLTGDRASYVLRALKLAAASVAFDRLDYALMICRSLEERGLVSLASLADEKSGVKYIALLRDLVKAAEEAERASPPVIQRPGEEAPLRMPVSPSYWMLADPVSRVLFQHFGAGDELAAKHIARVAQYRGMRGVPPG